MPRNNSWIGGFAVFPIIQPQNVQIGKLIFVEDVDNLDSLSVPGNVVKDMAARTVAAHPLIAVQVLRAGGAQVRPLPDEPTRFENLVAVALGLLRSDPLTVLGGEAVNERFRSRVTAGARAAIERAARLRGMGTSAVPLPRPPPHNVPHLPGDADVIAQDAARAKAAAGTLARRKRSR